MRLNFRGIPAKVIKGQVPKYISVSTLYRSTIIREIMTRVNRAFWTKSEGETDELGNKWKPLAPATIRYKPATPIQKETYRIGGKGDRSPGLLNPEQRKKFERIYRKELAALKKVEFFDRIIEYGIGDARKIATRKAWAAIKESPPELTNSINIRTGALIASTAPGRVHNNRYYPPKRQIVEIFPNIHIRLDLPYVDAVDAVRPPMPDNIELWIKDAHEIAITAAKGLYDNLRASS